MAGRLSGLATLPFFMDTKIIRFCQSLQNATVGPTVNNFYAAKRTNTQRYNLQRYLQTASEHNSKIMVVGEAPGYNGCARTGIPFSSQRLLAEEVIPGLLFGEANGFRVKRDRAVHEQTAASMWQLLKPYGIIPLMWNAYPFHPHRPGNPLSNRKPSVSEIRDGQIYLLELLDLFGIERVVGVGRSAQAALEMAGVSHECVRHPSYGGKPEFMASMREILSTYVT
jgi:uracil-DNA glycosylase